jgi:glyoxylase-like metal-dependent hydrolase (beta-lactamase superfamily II)/rhodanese-related sulfurtransferase
MYVEQLYTGCLAEAAYYIESNGEAAIIDPLRETEPYTELAEKRGASIKYIFETHFHADFVSGHLDLARKSGATIVFGPNAAPQYTAYIAEDQEIFNLGNIRIKVLHTPGHTMESTTYLLLDEEDKEHSIFTGDTLFIGDVGRPDLAVKSDLTKEDLAGHLYDSLQKQILSLPDEVIVYPGHGAGSQCGKNMSKETISTVGDQKKFNYALQPMSREQFVEVVTDGLSDPPAYFPENARINRAGYQNIDEVMERNLKALDLANFKQAIAEGAKVLDTRDPAIYEQASVPGSLNIGLNGQYAVWVGTLIRIDQPLVLVTDPEKAKEAVMRLARVGFENVKGYLDGGIKTWSNASEPTDKVKSIGSDLVGEFIGHGYQVLDVRNNTEAQTEHVGGALNIPLKDLPDQLEQLEKDARYLVHCAGGYRSMIAASILKANGIKDFVNVSGGFDQIRKNEGIELIAGKCPTQLRNEKLAAL